MTTMMTSSQFGLEDMEDLLLVPSSPMADPLGSLLFHPDLEEHTKRGGGTTSVEGVTSPLTSSSLSSSSSPPPFYSPPQSPSIALNGGKASFDPSTLSFPWSEHPQMSTEVTEGDVYGDLDWMTEKMDLSEFDLDSLIGTCGPTDVSASAHDDLLASLDCSMEFDALSVPADPHVSPGVPFMGSPALLSEEPTSVVDRQEVPSSPECVPEPEEELEIKSEPISPEPTTFPVSAPTSPSYTLDLGSEVDVADSEVKPLVVTVAPEPQRFVLSLSPTRILLVLAPKTHLTIPTAAFTTTEVVHHQCPTSPSPRSSRSRPYPDPRGNASPSTSTVTSVNDSCVSSDEEETMPLKAPRNKKLKKMEQNKTAATRYRHKKRVEQESLTTEYAVLQKKNVELNERAESMAREIEYLKELMEEVRATRMRKGLSADL